MLLWAKGQGAFSIFKTKAGVPQFYIILLALLLIRFVLQNGTGFGHIVSLWHMEVYGSIVVTCN